MQAWLLGLRTYLRYYLDLLRGSELVITRFSGSLIHTDQALNVIFYGSSNLLADAFLNPGYQQEVLGSFQPLRLRAAIQRYGSADVVLYPHLPWQARPEIVIPDYLEAILPLPAAMEGFMKQLRGNVRRSVQQALKGNVSFEEGHSLDDYREFHEQMLIPYLRTRHGEHAYLDTAENMYAQAGRSHLVFVSENGQRLGGFLLLKPRISGVAYFNKLGLHPAVYADKERMRQLNALLYYKMFSMSMEQGYPAINLGITPPVFGNGILWYKSSWGAQIIPNTSLHRYALSIAGPNRASVLAHMQAVVEMDADKLRVNLAMRDGIEDDLKRHRFNGLAHIALVNENRQIIKHLTD